MAHGALKYCLHQKTHRSSCSYVAAPTFPTLGDFVYTYFSIYTATMKKINFTHCVFMVAYIYIYIYCVLQHSLTCLLCAAFLLSLESACTFCSGMVWLSFHNLRCFSKRRQMAPIYERKLIASDRDPTQTHQIPPGTTYHSLTRIGGRAGPSGRPITEAATAPPTCHVTPTNRRRPIQVSTHDRHLSQGSSTPAPWVVEPRPLHNVGEPRELPAGPEHRITAGRTGEIPPESHQ